MELLIVTGMSGAGKSAVVDALEDLGYFCADNLPPAIIPTIAQFVSKTDNAQKIATVTDIRVGKKMFNEFPNVLKTLEEVQIYQYPSENRNMIVELIIIDIVQIYQYPSENRNPCQNILFPL